MDYSVFEQMKENGAYAIKESESQQKYMERILTAACQENPAGSQNRINDMICPELVECDVNTPSLKLEIPLKEWMLNPKGTLHGGIMTTSMDMTMGLLARFFRQSNAVSTVNLCVNFMRGVKADTEDASIYVTVIAQKVGRRVIFNSAQITDARSGKVAATATSTFM